METGLPVVGCPGSRMRMRRGSRAARRQPRSAAGVGAREGLGLRGGCKNRDARRGLQDLFGSGHFPLAAGRITIQAVAHGQHLLFLFCQAGFNQIAK